MDFVSVFSIIGIIVLALAVIALAISVSGISSRLKELTDTVMLEPLGNQRMRMDTYDEMYDLPPRRTNTSMYQPPERRGETRRAPGPQRGSAPQRTSIPQRASAPQRTSNSQRLNAPQRASYSSGFREIQPAANYDYPASSTHEMEPYSTQSYMPVQTTPAGMQQSYGANDYINNDPYGDDEFFETYRNRDDEGHYLRGRRPTIPFGADKSVVDRRRDSYVGSVADSEYDPDSIDFTRVQGYQRAGGRY